MTLALEIIGIGILVLWSIIPVQEFTRILRQIRKRNADAAQPRATEPDSPH